MQVDGRGSFRLLNSQFTVRPFLPSMKNATASSGETEGNWLQEIRAESTLRQLEQLLRECCIRLYSLHKVEGRVAQKSDAPTEKFNLAPRSTVHDNLHATVTLHGENIVHTEVNLKYVRNVVGFYRATAVPEVHWKLQQVQDAGNQCAKALLALIRGTKRYEDALKSKEDGARMGDLILSVLTSVKEGVKAARTSLTIPKRKSLVELCQFQPLKSFDPPLPHDILLSYYVSSAKLVCAAYQVVSKANGVQTVTIYQAECQLPKIIEVLQLLATAFAVAHDFIANYSMLDN